MKKSLLALAVLGAFAGVASAQSSVTLYGTVDLNGRVVKTDGQGKRFSLSQDGINSSQLGFRGVEDLGGGLKASFMLLAGVNADTGTTNTKFFNRRATVSLLGGFGEVRLGRDYTPTFWNNTIFDAFGTNGLGDSSGVAQMLSSTFVRADNSIGYFLPSGLGGFYGQFMVAAGEGAPVAAATVPAGTQASNAGLINNQGRYMGGRLGFAAGPFDIAGSYGTVQLDRTAGQPDYKTANVGGSFDLGVLKLMGYYNEDKLASAKDKRFSLSTVVPLGQGEIHASYNLSKYSNGAAASKIDKISLGYVYNLSKRTALYSTVARLDNKDSTTATLGSVAGGSAAGSATPGGKSTGAEFGLRHFF